MNDTDTAGRERRAAARKILEFDYGYHYNATWIEGTLDALEKAGCFTDAASAAAGSVILSLEEADMCLNGVLCEAHEGMEPEKYYAFADRMKVLIAAAESAEASGEDAMPDVIDGYTVTTELVAGKIVPKTIELAGRVFTFRAYLNALAAAEASAE